MIEHSGKSISLGLVLLILGGFRGEQMEERIVCR